MYLNAKFKTDRTKNKKWSTVQLTNMVNIGKRSGKNLPATIKVKKPRIEQVAYKKEAPSNGFSSSSNTEISSASETEDESNVRSSSDNSMEEDEGFLRKPRSFVLKCNENINLPLKSNLEKQIEKHLSFNTDNIKAAVSTIKVFNGFTTKSPLENAAASQTESEVDTESSMTSESEIDTSEDESENESEEVQAEDLTKDLPKSKAEENGAESNAETEVDSEIEFMDSETESETTSEPEQEAESVTNSDEGEESKIVTVSESDPGATDKIVKVPAKDLTKALPKSKAEEQGGHIATNPDLELEKCIFENSLKTNKVLVVLKQNLEVYGTLTLTLLCGRMNINGYKVTPLQALNIYSPKGCNWVQLSPKASKKPPKDRADWQELNEAFTLFQLKRIQSNYVPTQDAIVLLQRNNSAKKLLETFAQHMAENVFPVVGATNRPYCVSERLLNCLLQSSDGSRTLQVPAVWQKLAQQVTATGRIMVTGGKGVGKSTLIRYLVNHKLEQFSRLLLIDLDIGQPELFVPQTISCSVLDTPLLGPGLFLNHQPERAYVVGHVNVIMCAEQYMRAVRKLLSYCSSQFAGMTWFINTMGYNKGFGLELMALLINYVQPTNVVQIDGLKSINNFDKLLDASLSQVVPIIYTAEEFRPTTSYLDYTLHRLSSALPETKGKLDGTWQMSAKDVRYANLLARLSVALRGNTKHLTNCLPLCVDLSKLQVVHLTSDEYTREELIAGMEANVVYLCKRSVDKQPLECLGIGVVRAVDNQANKLYLLPAMPLQRMENVNCLVLGGDLSLPQGYFKQQGADVATNVPFVFNIDDSKSSKSIQQIYYRPPQFLGSPKTKITEPKQT